MGYTTADIANITEPKKISLAALPNFVQFESKPGVKVFLELSLEVTGTPTVAASLIRVTEPNGAVHNFSGTLDPDEVAGPVFLISADPAQTAENIRRALLSLPWLKANFEINVPYEMAGGVLVNGNAVTLRSKGTGLEYNLTLTSPNNAGAYALVIVNAASVNADSLSGEAVTAEVLLDVYTDLGLTLGEADAPTTAAALGRYVTTLTKTYAGGPVWFDVNALFSQYQKHNVPTGSGWLDTGTVRGFRFMVKVGDGLPFYQSSALYVLNGYDRRANLDDYVFKGGTVRLLTNKPRTPYVLGQREYLNFILEKLAAPVTLAVNYRAYTTGGILLGTSTKHTVNTAALATVNTCILDIDQVITDYPNAGIVRVALAAGPYLVSNDLEYEIRPDCLHLLRPFTFLNSLGGWDAFNFDAGVKDEIKPTSETYSKTVTPGNDTPEAVYNVALANTFTVEGAPVRDEVATWLKELGAAKVVLDQGLNYIVKEDFTLVTSAASSNMQTPVIKYRLSKPYNNA